MPEAYVNYMAVVVSGLVPMILGFLWYGPLFGKPWMQMVGMTDKMKEESMKKGMGATYGMMLVGAMIMAYVLAHVIDWSGSFTMGEGMQIGFWMWLGFVATTMLSSFLFTVKPKPWALYVLDTGYYMVSLMIMGAILAVWI